MVGVQGELALGKDPKKRGGVRAGAGRRRIKGRKVSEAHRVRARVSRHVPVHVTLRIAEDVQSLRQRKTYAALRAATIVAATKQRVRIAHVSIQRDHIHLIVEADDRMALARGMQAFEVSAARKLNRVLGRRGTVFSDRYNARALKSPREVRNALSYVLNNWRHHLPDREHAPFALDAYSSAMAFTGWRDCDPRAVRARAPAVYEELATVPGASWLLREGWQRHGLLSIKEVPGHSRR